MPATNMPTGTMQAGLTWETSPSISQGTRCDPACHHKQRNYFITFRTTALLLLIFESRFNVLRTFLILRLMIDSAANTLSPTADSSMFTPVLPTVSLLDANVSGAVIFSSPSHSEFPTDHNTNGRQSNFLRRC